MKRLLSLLLTAVMLAAILSLTVIPAFALPSPDQTKVFDADVSVDGDQMNITGKSTNNVTAWTSFDVQEGETVQFADNNDYMIVVNSKSPTQINGTLQGGGEIYIINTNGVISGSDSTINVGNLFAPKDKFTSWSGSALSVGYPWVVVTIALAVVSGLGGFFLGRKKPAPAGGAESEDEE